MSTINNGTMTYYIFVQTEKVTRGVEISSHPVEKGLSITDNVKRSPITISIEGKIVGISAKGCLDFLNKAHQSGQLIKYSGRNVLENAVIEKFDTDHPNTVWGGCNFSMDIKEIRIAKRAYVVSSSKKTQSGTQQIAKKNTSDRYYTVKKGDCLWNIAVKYYGSGSKYTKIYEANKVLLKNSTTIHPNQKLKIPY